MIAFHQAPCSAEGVGRAVTHAQFFEAASAARRVVEQPEFLASGCAIRAAKIGPRSAVPKEPVGDADESVPVAEGYDDLPVLQPDHAGRAEARYGDARQLVEEFATVGVGSAFWHEACSGCATRFAVSPYHSLSYNSSARDERHNSCRRRRMAYGTRLASRR